MSISTAPTEPDALMASHASTYVELCGGFGNQLFQAAAAMAIAARTGNELRFDIAQLVRGRQRQYELSRFPHGAKAGVFPSANPHWQGQRFVESGFHYDQAVEALSGEMLLRGYFQSPRYFSGIEDRIRAVFDLEPLVGSDLRSRAATLETKGAISVHVRRGDYVSNPGALAFHGRLDATYYRNAISLIRRACPGAPMLVFSDEPLAAGDVLEGLGSWQIARGASHFEDMYLMQHCRHHVIANSSFSWWGAWLGQHEGGMIVAPRNWFAREAMLSTYCGDLYPEGWILL
jgi:hypothetical protein